MVISLEKVFINLTAQHKSIDSVGQPKIRDRFSQTRTITLKIAFSSQKVGVDSSNAKSDFLVADLRHFWQIFDVRVPIPRQLFCPVSL